MTNEHVLPNGDRLIQTFDEQGRIASQRYISAQPSQRTVSIYSDEGELIRTDKYSVSE